MKFSVLMTVYNTKAFLPEAIDSVLNQTYSDFEFLIIDDGSTDGSLEVLQEYVRRDKRIRLVAQANQGCSEAGNTGFRISDADWIFRVDSDDVMYPNRLARQVEFIKSHPDAKAVSAMVHFIDEHGRKIVTSRPDLFTREDWDVYHRECRPVVIPHTVSALHRQTVLDVGGYNYDYFSDTYLFSRIVEAGHLILVQSEVLGAYRFHTTSVMSKNVFWSEVGSEWIHENWQRRRSGTNEIDWESYRKSWQGWGICRRLNQYRLTNARMHMREIARLLHSKRRLALSKRILSICLFAPDFVLSRVVRRSRKLRGAAG